MTLKCSYCQGDLFRSFNFLEKLGFFLPLWFSWHFAMECVNCGKKYKASGSWANPFLAGLVAIFTYNLGHLFWITFLFIGAWMLISLAKSEHTPTGSLGIGHTLIAGIFVGVLAFLSMYFSGFFPEPGPGEDIGETYLPWFVYSGVGIGFIAVLLDYISPIKLKEIT